MFIYSFDIDGTISLHNQPIDNKLAKLLAQLSQKNYIHFISGRTIEEFNKRILTKLTTYNALIPHILVSPCLGGALIHLGLNQYKRIQYKTVYQHIINQVTYIKLKLKILEIFKKHNIVVLHYGKNFIYKKYLISLSLVGIDAPTKIKQNFDPTRIKRKHIRQILQKMFKDFDFYIGGTSTIDITFKGVNKAYGMFKLIKYLNMPKEAVLYFGDKLIPTGNDYSVLKAGFKTFSVKDPTETLKKLQKLQYN